MPPTSPLIRHLFAAILLLFTTAAHADLEVLGGPIGGPEFSVGVANGSDPLEATGTDFGDVPLGDLPKSNEFRLKNTSSSARTITQLAASGSGFSITSGGVAAGGMVNLSGNGTRNFTVRFDSSTAGFKSGSISILTLEGDTFIFDLEGNVIGEPEIKVSGRPNTGAYTSITNGDTSPRNTDGTAFGTWGAADGALVRTFEIENTGDGILEIDSITIEETTSAFSLTGVPTVVAPGLTRTFSVKFNPQSHGTYNATVKIENNDSNEDPFEFDVSGIGEASGIIVLGGDTQTALILNGDDSPRTSDSTDFGTVEAGSNAISETFKITNLGNENLVFTAPIVENANAFSIGSAPAANSSVAPGASTTFEVVLSTSTAGTKYGTVSISTNDPNDGVYSFDVTAVATGAPEIVVEGEEPTLGNRFNIPEGASPPIQRDGTSYGLHGVNDGGLAHSFFIRNTGTARLNIDSITDGSDQFRLSSIPSSVNVNGEREFIVTFNPTSSGLKTATIKIENDDSNEDPFEFEVNGTGTAGRIEIGTGQDFATNVPNGDTTLGDFFMYEAGGTGLTKNFRIFNRGNEDLLINSVTENGGAFSIVDDPLAETLAPGETRDFGVKFAPTAAGSKRAKVTVLTDDPENSEFTFDVFGEATGDVLYEVRGPTPVPGSFIAVPSGATTSSVANGTDFGSYPVISGSLEREFQIVNTGTAQLSITSITEGSPNFSVSDVPSVVGVGNTKTFTISFNPTSRGAKFANIVITTNGAAEESFVFRVDGVGTAAELKVEIATSRTSNNLAPIANGDTTPSAEDGTLWTIDDGEFREQERILKLSNIGDDPLIVQSINFIGAGVSWRWDPWRFGTDWTLPYTLGTDGEDATIWMDVAFLPIISGQDSVTVEIELLNSPTMLFSFDMLADVVAVADLELGGRSTDTAGTPFVAVPDGSTTSSVANGTSFGDVDVDGGSVSHTFEIENTGTAQLEIEGITETSPHFTVVSVPDVVSVNQNQEFTVRFNPNSIGRKTATITIQSNADGDKALYTFEVSGRGEGADIAVTGGDLLAEDISNGDVTPDSTDGTDLGGTEVVGGRIERVFRFENHGNETLIINAATSSNPAFTLEGVPGPLDFIAPDGTDQFKVIFNPTAPGPTSAVITIGSNDPDENPFTFTVEGFGTDGLPSIEVSGPGGPAVSGGAFVEIGSVEVGGTLISTFNIENTGTGNLTVSSISENSPLFATIGAPTEALVPGESDDFRVRFQPTAEGPFTAVVTIASDATNTPSFDLKVRGIATATAPPAGSDIAVLGGRDQDVPIASGDTTPRTFDGTDIGQIAVGESAQRTFRISNVGTAALNISEIEVAGFSAVISNYPASIAAGASADVTVTISPQLVGQREVDFQIDSDDPDESPFSFTISWEGVESAYPLEITSFGLVGDNAELTFISNPFKTYRIAYSTDMVTWSRPVILSGIAGDTTPQTYELVNALSIVGERAYFRVEEE